jgi:hypothetical protein
MLYVIHRANSPELTYRGGQEPIVHLEADVHEVIAWADGTGCRWAFSLSNAGAYYAQFRSSVAALADIDWGAVTSADFRDPGVKEGKQAEFLVRGFFPWTLVRRIGVRSRAIATCVAGVITASAHRPTVELRPDWYY